MKVLKLFIRQRRGKVALTLLLLLGQSVGTLLIPVSHRRRGGPTGILAGRHGRRAAASGALDAGRVPACPPAWPCGGQLVSPADLAALFGRDMRARLLLQKSQELSVRQFDEVGVSSMVTRSTSDIANHADHRGPGAAAGHSGAHPRGGRRWA